MPIAIDGSVNVQKKGSKLINPGKVKVEILPPVSFDDIYDLGNKEFSIAASKRVRDALSSALEGKVSAPDSFDSRGIEPLVVPVSAR